jgi:transcriptional regulator with XRE-family HTH domain
MSGSSDLVQALKGELKSAGLTYAALARELGIAESSVKRIFAKGDMPLSRIDEVLRVLKMDFSELARKIVEAAPARGELTLAQEKALASDRRLMLVALCCVSQWSVEDMTRTYTLSEADCVSCLVHLDKLGFIELRPHNRYRLKIGHAFRWRPDGPVMAYFREQAVPDYFAGRFDGHGEHLVLVHGQLSAPQAQAFGERLQRLTQDFAQRHLTDQPLPRDRKQGYTLVIGMRYWPFSGFRDLRAPREPAQRPPSKGVK